MPAAVTAFAPANGSLIFQTYEATPHYGRGSLGVGFTLEAGVRVRVSRQPTSGADSLILVRGERWAFPTVAQVISRLSPQPVLVEIEADFPFGCGYGMSGASALATAYALGALFELPHTARDLAFVAHEAEVENATGRGDVGGQYNGGLMKKTIPGEPLTVEHFAIPETTIYSRIYGPISTSEVLRDQAMMERVNAAGAAAMSALAAEPPGDLEALLALSLTFARQSGLLTSPALMTSIAEAQALGGQASMVMLGEAVVSTVPITGSTPYRISRCPARVLQTF